MVLYHIYSGGFLGMIITHRLTCHKKERAELLVGLKTSPLLLETGNQLVKAGIFDKIFTYDDSLHIKMTQKIFHKLIERGEQKCLI